MTRKSIAALALAIATALTLTACGEQTGSEASESGTPAAFDDADVAFAQQMIPHHEQAVLMSQMAESHASSAEVRRLAAGIEDAQGPEIDTMSGWLEEWGEDVPDGSMGGMDHGMQGMRGMAGMPGMMSERQLGSLGRAHGGSWDRMFLRMMIAHHEGAIEMANTEIADGQNDDAVALAGRIVEAQQAEIEQMREMLRS
jgi:uncharacterized protein (DUF305 family)